MSIDLMARAMMQADESDSECEVLSHEIAVGGSASPAIAEQHDGSVDTGAVLSQQSEGEEDPGADEGEAAALSQQRRRSGQRGS